MIAPLSTGTPALQLSGVTKAFGAKKVLDGIDLTVSHAESVVIIGGSGTGKSVMLKCVLGLLTPDAGSIRVGGQELVGASESELRRLRARFGMLFQGGALFDSLSVIDNVGFGLVQGHGRTREAARKIAGDKLAAVGLDPSVVGKLFPAELSGGMQKRVALARAIATEPEILFFDEPTTGLDPIMADVINDLIRKCVRDLGATAVSITHDMVSARKISDRIAMLYNGMLIWVGPTADIDRSGNPYVEQFIHGRADGPIKMQVRGG